MNRLLLTLGGGIMLFATVLAQDRDPRDLANMPPIVKKFMLARRTARYTGIRTVEFKKEGEWVKHIEFVSKDGIKSRTEFPDDSAYAGQIIVDNGKERMHFYPDRNEIEVEPAHLHEGIDKDRGEGEHHRQLLRTVTAGGSVAGYDTQEVTVSDQNGNVMQQMWIEPKTGVRLKLVLFDRVGSRAGSYEFSKINFRPTFAPGDFTIDRKGALIVRPAEQARRLALKLGLTPLVLGENSGFQLQNARVIHPGKQDVLVQTYVGDAGRFTFFQLRGDVDENRLSRFARGRLSTYSWKRGDEAFALVGNLSQDQLGQIAKTLGDR